MTGEAGRTKPAVLKLCKPPKSSESVALWLTNWYPQGSGRLKYYVLAV